MTIEIPPFKSLPECLDSITKAVIEQAIEQTKGNKSRASQLLGINRTRLVGIMRRLEMPLNKPYLPKAKASVDNS